MTRIQTIFDIVRPRSGIYQQFPMFCVLFSHPVHYAKDLLFEISRYSSQCKISINHWEREYYVSCIALMIDSSFFLNVRAKQSYLIKNIRHFVPTDAMGEPAQSHLDRQKQTPGQETRSELFQ